MGIHYLDCNSQGITLYYFANCSKMTKDSNLVWVDCEMTGLDINTDHLLEIAVLITDKDLNILAEGPNLVIHQTDEIIFIIYFTSKLELINLKYFLFLCLLRSWT